MKLEGKTVIVTSNSSVFLKLTKLFIDNSGSPRSDFIVISENGMKTTEWFKRRVKKNGMLRALDEWFYIFYETLFNHWTNAERKYLNDIDISSFSPDIITDSVNKSKNYIINKLQHYDAKTCISIGSEYIPLKILEKYRLKINIHPGILPHYKGIGTPEAIMTGNFSNLGWCIHELTSKIDSGKIIYNHRISYNDLKNMTFAEVYISIYVSAILHFFTLPNNLLKIENDTNSKNSYNAFVRITHFIKFIFKQHRFLRNSVRIPKKRTV